MQAGATILRLGLAAPLSGISVGLLLAVSLLFAVLAAGPGQGYEPGEAPGPDTWLLAIRVAVQVGAAVATLPAFVAGAAMTVLGARFDAARRLPTWGGAGAVVGLAFWLLLELILGSLRGGERPSGMDAFMLPAFLFSGGGAALVFRAVMLLTGWLCVTPDDR
jgi:hypothetical protein